MALVVLRAARVLAVLEAMGDFSPPSSDDELPFGSGSPAAAVSSIAAGGQRKRPRPAPAVSARGGNDDEVVVLDSSSSDSDDCVNGGGAASSKRKRAPVSSSYTSKGYSDSDSSDDDDLLAGGPTFASRPGSGNGSGAASASGQNNDATEKLKQTLNRLESLSSAASSAGISSTSATGNKSRKRTAEERAAEAAARKRQKAREVEARKRAREAERAAKARQKEEAKVAKARQVLEDKQASGKFAAEEICALVDASLARAGADDDSDAAAFAAAAASASAGEDGAPLPTGVGPLALAALEAKNYRAVIEGQTTQSVRIGDSNGMDSAAPVRWDGLPVGRGAGCVRWIRRDHLAGGSAGVASAPSTDDNVQRTDMVAIVFYNPRAFLRLLERDAAGMIIRSSGCGCGMYDPRWQRGGKLAGRAIRKRVGVERVTATRVPLQVRRVVSVMIRQGRRLELSWFFTRCRKSSSGSGMREDVGGDPLPQHLRKSSTMPPFGF